jgi:hypothetical protein
VSSKDRAESAFPGRAANSCDGIGAEPGIARRATA